MLRGPGLLGLTRVVEIPGCGHAPALNVPEQLELVSGFIEQHGDGTAATSHETQRYAKTT